jgi:hypothetical protein
VAPPCCDDHVADYGRLVPQGYDVPLTLDPDLLHLLVTAIGEGTTVATVANGRPNTVGAISADGVEIKTERSAPSYELVPAWMLNAAWRNLRSNGEIGRQEMQDLHRGSAVFALLARLPSVRVLSSRPVRLGLDPRSER